MDNAQRNEAATELLREMRDLLRDKDLLTVSASGLPGAIMWGTLVEKIDSLLDGTPNTQDEPA